MQLAGKWSPAARSGGFGPYESSRVRRAPGSLAVSESTLGTIFLYIRSLVLLVNVSHRTMISTIMPHTDN